MDASPTSRAPKKRPSGCSRPGGDGIGGSDSRRAPARQGSRLRGPRVRHPEGAGQPARTGRDHCASAPIARRISDRGPARKASTGTFCPRMRSKKCRCSPSCASSSAGRSLELAEEHLGIDRLYKVLIESRRERTPAVLGLAIGGDGNQACADRIAGLA